MIENTTFNDEWNKLQKSFWEKADLKINENTNLNENLKNTLAKELPVLFEQWFKDVDKCWQDHARDTSSDIDLLYKKLSSTSKYFFNSSESIITQKKDETTDALVSEYINNISKMFEETTDHLNSENTSDSNEINNSNKEIDSLLKLPLENWQRHLSLFNSQYSNQQQSTNTASKTLEYDSDNSELSLAMEAYLSALQEYQSLLLKLLKNTTKELLEELRSKLYKTSPTTRTMTTWLEMLDENYKALISSTEYSEVYANVFNSWMLVLNKSNLSFSEFMQSASSGQSKSK